MIIIKSLILLENSHCIQSLLKELPNIPGEIIFISLSPGASYAFEKANIRYKSTRDYPGSEERYRQGLDNYRRIDRITSVLDSELIDIHNIPSITPARYSIYNLKFLLDALWTTVHRLKTIIEAENPDSIRLYTSLNFESDLGSYSISNNESVFGQVLKMKGWNIPVVIIQQSDNKSAPNQYFYKINKYRIYLLSWFKSQEIIYNLGLIWKRDGIITAVKTFCYYLNGLNKKPVLIYNVGYNWDDSLFELYNAAFSPVYRLTDEDIDKLPLKYAHCHEQVYKLCWSHHSFQEFNTIFGIEISEFFFTRLSKIIENSIRESVASYQITLNIIREKDIRSLLHSVRERAIGHAVVQAAKDSGIPVVSWQHGGAGYCYHPMMPFIEYVNSDWHFVFGEGVADSYRMTSEQIGLEKTPIFIPVGSSSLDRFIKNGRVSPINLRDRPIVYITTAYLRNLYAISQPFDPADWDEQLWLIQKSIINLAKLHPEREFIIKLHPSHKDKEPLLSYANDHNIKNLKIVTSEMTIRQLTDIADFVIFDLISTGVLQVLTSNLPVFIYSGMHYIDQETHMQLKKRAYINNNFEEFIKIIQEYVQTKKSPDASVDCSNSDFILNYGTDMDVLNSSENAIKKLKEIIT